MECASRWNGINIVGKLPLKVWQSLTPQQRKDRMVAKKAETKRRQQERYAQAHRRRDRTAILKRRLDEDARQHARNTVWRDLCAAANLMREQDRKAERKRRQQEEYEKQRKECVERAERRVESLREKLARIALEIRKWKRLADRERKWVYTANPAIAALTILKYMGKKGKYATREEFVAARKEYKRAYAILHKRQTKASRRGKDNAKRCKAKAEESDEVREWYVRLLMSPLVRCFWCGSRVPLVDRVGDHFVPVARGGEHSVDNLVPACYSCNSRKSKMMPEEFYALLENEGRVSVE